MAYIRDLDVEFPDPDNGRVFICEDCRWAGTWEDCDRYTQDGWEGITCPHCGNFAWWQR